MDGAEANRLMGLLERLIAACERMAGPSPLHQEPPAAAQQAAENDLLGPKQVALLLKCSYGEARRRMLEGRIRAVKDGRWLRSRREWVEEYLEGKTVCPAGKDEVAVPARSRKRRAATMPAGGTALDFLRDRQKPVTDGPA